MTRLLDWQEEPIGRHHDRKAFDCGDGALDEYLRRYARQNHESGGAKTFVAASSSEPARVLGYYTMGPGAIEFAHAPADLTRRLGRCDVPVFRLGQLAVDRTVGPDHRAPLGRGAGAAAARRHRHAARRGPSRRRRGGTGAGSGRRWRSAACSRLHLFRAVWVPRTRLTSTDEENVNTFSLLGAVQ